MPSLRSKDDGDAIPSVNLHSNKNVSQAIQRKKYMQRASSQSNGVIDGVTKKLRRMDATVVPTLRNPLGIGIEVIVGNNDGLKGKKVAMTKTSKPRGKKLNSRAGVTLGRRKACKKSNNRHIKIQGLKKELIETDLRQKLGFLTQHQFEKLRSFKVGNLLQMLDLTLKQIISVGFEKEQMEMLITILKHEDTEMAKLSKAQNSEELISHVKLDEDTDGENPLVIDESFSNTNEGVENNACSDINVENCCTSQSNVQNVDGKQGKTRPIDDIEKHLSMMRKSKIPTFLATAAEIKSELTYIVADLNATEESILLKINESTTTATTTTTVVSPNVNNLNLHPMFLKSNQEPIISTSKQKGNKLKNTIRFNDANGKQTLKQLKKVPSNRLRSSQRATVEKKTKQTILQEKTTTVVDLKCTSTKKPKINAKKTKLKSCGIAKNTENTTSKLILNIGNFNDNLVSDIMSNTTAYVLCAEEQAVSISGNLTVNIKSSGNNSEETQYVDVASSEFSSSLKKGRYKSIESRHEFEKMQAPNLTDINSMIANLNALQDDYTLSTYAIKSTEYQHAFEEYALSSNIEKSKTHNSSSFTTPPIPITLISPSSVILSSLEICAPPSPPATPCSNLSALKSSNTNIASGPSPLKLDLIEQKNVFESCNTTGHCATYKKTDSSNYVVQTGDTTFEDELKNILHSKSPNSFSAASIKHELSIDQPKVVFTQPTLVLMDHKQRSAVDADSTTSSPELTTGNGKTLAKCEILDNAHIEEKMPKENNNESIEDRKSNMNTEEKKVKLTRRSFQIEKGNLTYKKHGEAPSKQPKYADDDPLHSTTPPLTPKVLKLERPLSTKKNIQNWDVAGATSNKRKPFSPTISDSHTIDSPGSFSIDPIQSTPQNEMERDLRYKLEKFKNRGSVKKIAKMPNYKDATKLSLEKNVLNMTSVAIRKLAYDEEDSKDSYYKENSLQQTDDSSEDWDIDEKNIDTSHATTFDKFYDGEVEGPQSPNDEKPDELQHFNIQATNKVRRHINFDSKSNDGSNSVDGDAIASPIFSPISEMNLTNQKINLNDYIPAVQIDGHMSYPAMTYNLYEFDMPKYEINKPESIEEILLLNSLACDPRLVKYRNKTTSHTNIPQIASPISHHSIGVGDPRRRNNIPPTSPYATNNQQLVIPIQYQHQTQQQTPNMLLYGCLQRSPWYQSLMSTMKIQINQSISVLVCAINNFQKIRLEDPNAVFDIFKLYCAGELLEILENLGLFVDVNGAIIEQRSASSFGGRSFASSAPINSTYSFIQQVMPAEYTKTSRTASTGPKFISCYVSTPPMPEPSFHHTQRRHSGLKAPYISLGSPAEQSALDQSHKNYNTEEESWDLDENIASPSRSADSGCDHKRRNAELGQRRDRFGNRFEHRNSVRGRNSFGNRKRY